MIILDTNVVSELMDAEPNATVINWLDRQSRTSLWTTSVTVMEIRLWPRNHAGWTPEKGARGRVERVLIEENFERRVHFFDHARRQKRQPSLMAARHRAGRPGELRDTMIAGIAQAQHATLATRNVRHFDDLNVPVLDPWSA